MGSESFEDLYNESIKNDKVLNKIETGKIIKITNKGDIFVDLGYKADGIVPRGEFSDNENENPSNEFKAGDDITVQVLKLNDGTGNVLLSYKRIRAQKERELFAQKVNAGDVFEGKINQITDKGVITEVFGTRVFIPLSLSGIGKNEKLESYNGKNITFEIIEFNPENRKVVGSHKIITDRERKSAEEKLWQSIEVGRTFEGYVKSINSYGVFVDLNGVDGLLHMSEVTWRRNANANNYFKIGQKVNVSIKDVDKQNKKIQLAYSDKEVNPWEKVSGKYAVDEIVKGKVNKLVQFGAFVELEDGIEGLVHISQISDERISKPEQALEIGQTVDVKILDIDTENRKLSLSIKEAHADDWKKEIKNVEGITFELKD